MIQCKECGFSVNELMRFALMKNICPSCGAGLLSGEDSDAISVIQSKLLSQRFASSITETLAYDLSLFIFNELKNGFGLGVRSDSSSKARKSISFSEDDDSEDEDDDDVSSVRREVEREFADQLNNLDEDVAPANEDALSKAERLKRLHQQRMLNNSDISDATKKIKRGGGFKGISRST